MELFIYDDCDPYNSFYCKINWDILKMNNRKEFFDNLKKGQKNFGEDIANLVNSVLLTFVYIIGVGPTSILGRLFGKNFLNLKPDKNRKSYWEDLDINKRNIEEYYRQF